MRGCVADIIVGALLVPNACVVLAVIAGLDTVDTGGALKADGGDSVEVRLLDGAIDSGNVVSTPG